MLTITLKRSDVEKNGQKWIESQLEQAGFSSGPESSEVDVDVSLDSVVFKQKIED